MKASLVRGLAALIASGGLCAAASAQIGGTVFLDYGGFNGTPQGNVTALDTTFFPGLAAADLQPLKDAILADMRAAYTGFSINITDQLPAGNFTRIVIGNTGTVSTDALGVANQIDFRNTRFDNIVSVLAKPITAAPFPAATRAQYAQCMANVASHELGHVLGLMHSDVVSTSVASGSAAVQDNEIMTAVRLYNGAREITTKTFGEYSKRKVYVGTHGVNLELENGTTTFYAPGSADPARAGATGATIGTAINLNFDTDSNVVVLGNLNSAADVYKFTAVKNTRVSTEVFSQALAAAVGTGTPGFVSRIANPVTNAIVELLDSTGTVIQATQYTPSSDFDGAAGGDAGSDALIYGFNIPADGTYGVRVRSAANTGDYELYVAVPAPASMALLAFGLGVVSRRRR
jgi:hypothetical protein